MLSNVGRSLAERRLYPRSVERLTNDEKEAWALRLARNPVAMIESGTTFAIAYSMILREVFEVRPHAAMGYSLGEISMLWSAGVWNTGDAGSDAWHASPLFKTRLFGPKEAVREAWGIQPENNEFWSTYLLKAPEAEVRAYVDQEPRVYLTIVNLPEEVVIAGEGKGCQRIIQSLGCHSIRVPFDSVIHNEVVRSEYNTFVQLYTHPIHYKPEITFFSAAEYAPLTLEADALAHAIADMTCKPVDLPRLVQTVYESGARIFIELGPQATCSRWIDRILSDKPHVAVPINRSGMGDFHGVLSVLAQLITNRIHVNLLPLTPLYQQEPPRRVVLPQNGSTKVLPTRVDIPEIVYQPVSMRVAREALFSAAKTNQDKLQQGAFGNVYQKTMLTHQIQLAQNHMAFLQTRHHALQNTSTLIEMQIAIAEKMLDKNRVGETTTLHAKSAQKPVLNKRLKTGSVLFSKDQLEDFASGNVELCFGIDYAVYRGRRLPRIPNGDLLLMSRIIDIDGTRGVFDNEPRLVAEFDVADDAWFFTGESDANVPPYAVLMEIALQPCGFLSAYLGSTLATPHMDYYFRNLDGRGQLLSDCNVRGKTIRNSVKLLSSIALRGIIMQRYQYVLDCEGSAFYKGEATFGFFTADALSDQVGLDKGLSVPPHFLNNSQTMTALPVPPKDQLHGLDNCAFNPEGGRYGKGYIYGEVQINPDAWFFDCHFYQDPVMPGSLGIDMIYQALDMSLRTIWESGGRSGQGLRLFYGSGHDLVWTYRGQVRPNNNIVSIELHIKELSKNADGITAVAEASLWVDTLRIYEVKELEVRLGHV